MDPNHDGYSPSSHNVPDSASGAKEGTDAASSSLEVVFENPQLRKSSAEPSLELPGHFTSLIQDLSQEDSQLNRRRQQGLDNPRKVYDKLAKLKEIDLIQNPYQRDILGHSEKLVIIAATVVDSYLGNEDVSTSTFMQLNGRKLSQETILRDQRMVRQIIKLIDELYLCWGHEFALELLVLLDTPISILRQQGARKFDKLNLLLRESTPSTKLRSWIKLYIPFLVLLLRPEYRLVDVQQALQTSIFNQQDLNSFRRVCYGPIPKYDPIRDVWSTSTSGSALIEFIDYKNIYRAMIGRKVSGFESFRLSPVVQQKAAQASRGQSGCTPTGNSLFAYDWFEEIHGPVIDLVVHDLKKSGFLQPQDVYVKKVSLSLPEGSSTVVPVGQMQILVPTAPSQGTLSVSLHIDGSIKKVDWNKEIGYILDQNTMFSTPQKIGCISLLVIPQ
ncbi:unnamed protein product [Fusarium langsethiae]|nr:unnamed protein product [Fusarium langsethiae]